MELPWLLSVWRPNLPINPSRWATFMAILEINDRLRIPDDAFAWKFARSGGPGGQNVNKVASKATLIWSITLSPDVPADVKHRLAALYPVVR